MHSQLSVKSGAKDFEVFLCNTFRIQYVKVLFPSIELYSVANKGSAKFRNKNNNGEEKEAKKEAEDLPNLSNLYVKSSTQRRSQKKSISDVLLKKSLSPTTVRAGDESEVIHDKDGEDGSGKAKTRRPSQMTDKHSAFFRVEALDPQINFLDVKTHSSMIVVAGKASIIGRKSNYALYRDLKREGPKLKQEIKLQMEREAAYTVLTVDPKEAKEDDDENLDAVECIQDVR